jgi:hypothetical protein
MNVSGTNHLPSISGNQKAQHSDQKNGNLSGMNKVINVVASTSRTPAKNAPSALVPQTSLKKNETNILSESDKKTLAEINTWSSSIQVLRSNRASQSKPLNEYQRRKEKSIKADEDQIRANFNMLVERYGKDMIAELLTNQQILIPPQEPEIHPTLKKLVEIPISGFSHNQRRNMKNRLKNDPYMSQLAEIEARRKAIDSLSALTIRTTQETHDDQQ